MIFNISLLIHPEGVEPGEHNKDLSPEGLLHGHVA